MFTVKLKIRIGYAGKRNISELSRGFDGTRYFFTWRGNISSQCEIDSILFFPFFNRRRTAIVARSASSFEHLFFSTTPSSPSSVLSDIVMLRHISVRSISSRCLYPRQKRSDSMLYLILNSTKNGLISNPLPAPSCPSEHNNTVAPLDYKFSRTKKNIKKKKSTVNNAWNLNWN